MARPHTGIDVDLRQGWAYMLKRRAKLGVYVLAAAGFVLSQGLLHGEAEHLVELGVGLLGALGVHQTPNGD